MADSVFHVAKHFGLAAWAGLKLNGGMRDIELGSQQGFDFRECLFHLVDLLVADQGMGTERINI